ncbi:2'-5' RNA ligase family protein [Streptomyces sp. MJM8645]|uniref:2'-5' RNA ligase family protein n=1 Tax=Streptomycetaceae TaxID=2062 RepID=UPI0007AFCD36|nr:2'-5' RNA ligase family protein [Streptomyces sp. MJM8645]
MFSHEWKDPIGVCHGVEEWLPGDPRLPKTTPMGKPWPKDAGALVADVGHNLRTSRGRDVFEQVKQWHEEGGGAQWSIGYVVPKGGATKRAGVRIIHDLDLYEVSPVLHGAHPLTMALEVKGNPAGQSQALEYKATGPHGEPQVGQGVMIALFPPPEVSDALAHPQGTAAGDLHVTLAYLGQADALGGYPDDLPDLIRTATSGAPQLEGQLGGIGRFPPGEDGVPVWVPVDVPGLAELQQRVVSALAGSVFNEALRTDHGFTPHLTLGYDLPDDVPTVDATPVIFDELFVVRGTDRVGIPLGRPAEQDDVGPDIAPSPPAPPVPAPVGPAVEVKTAHQAVAAAKSVATRRNRLEVKSAHQAVAEAKSLISRIEEKSMQPPMAGSYEEQQSHLRDALQVLFLPNQDASADAAWVCIEATFPDRVIATVARPEPGETITYSVPYQNAGGDVVLGTPQRVELTVVAVDTEDPDGDEEVEEEAEPEEAAEARFLQPAAGRLADATSAIAVADVEPEQLENLRPAVDRLLRTLARKGMPISEGNAEPDDDFGDDWGLYDHLDDEQDQADGQGGAPDADAPAPATVPPGGPAPAPAVTTPGSPEPSDEATNQDEEVTLDPEEVEAQLKALAA